jgi:hypothetical protein
LDVEIRNTDLLEPLSFLDPNSWEFESSSATLFPVIDQSSALAATDPVQDALAATTAPQTTSFWLDNPSATGIGSLPTSVGANTLDISDDAFNSIFNSQLPLSTEDLVVVPPSTNHGLQQAEVYPNSSTHTQTSPVPSHESTSSNESGIPMSKHASSSSITIPASSQMMIMYSHDFSAKDTSSSYSPLTTTKSTISQGSSSPSDEDAKIRDRRRQKNTLAARKYRQKRLDRIAQLEQALSRTEKERDDLRIQVESWKSKAKLLQDLFEQGRTAG